MKKILKVEVRPRAGKQEIVTHEDELIVSVKSPAHDGKANEELLKAIKDYYKKYFTVISIRIVKGKRFKRKIIELIIE